MFRNTHICGYEEYEGLEEGKITSCVRKFLEELQDGSKMSKLRALAQDSDANVRSEARERLLKRKEYQKLKKRRNRQK